MPNLEKKLLKFYNEDVERVGFVLTGGKIIEVENIHPHPSKGFSVKSEDVKKYGDDAIATWHTHPKSSANLSTTDMGTYLVWDNLDHYIVGTDGVRKYIVVDGEVLNA